MSDEIWARHAQEAVSELLQQFPVVGIVGARQVGKSTLAALVTDGWTSIDLEREQDFQALARDPYLFLQQHQSKLVIDEAQELPAVFQALRVVVDERRDQKGRYIITGSSSPLLLEQLSESLAGRIGVLELGSLKATERWQAPLSPFYSILGQGIDAGELAALQPQISRSQLFDAWFEGGYPEPAQLETPRARRLWMDSYRATYLQRDIRKLFPRLNLEAFRTLVTMLARLSGNVINYSEVAQALSVSQPTARQYFDIADGTFIWRKLAPYTRKAVKRVVRMPRGHVRDSGLLHFLLNIGSQEHLIADAIVGRSWESFIIEEILKGLACALIPATPYFMRTRHGAEVDLVLEGHFGLLPIEVKYGTTVDHRSLRALRDFVEQYRLELGIVICNADSAAWLGDKILRLPATVL